MTGLTTKELARELGVSVGRVSQLVREGKLDGCWTGQGRARRFDLDKVAVALQARLNASQLLGNGAGTRKRLSEMTSGKGSAVLPEGCPLPQTNPDDLLLARTEEARQRARRLQMQNEAAAGTLVLASEVNREVSRALSQEIAEFEMMLREAARVVADEFDLDFKTVRQKLLQTWRTHRTKRSNAAAERADSARLSDAEHGADF